MKCTATVLALLVPGALALAQAPLKPQPRLGVIAGVNLASLSNQYVASNRTGFIGGVTFSLPVSNAFAFQPELLYTMKGVKSSDVYLSAAVKINYLEVPLLLRLEIPTPGGVRPFVYAGPSVALKTSCHIHGHEGKVSISASCDDFVDETESSASFSRVDAGAIVGGGLAFHVGGSALTIGARYELGLVAIRSNSDTKNRVLSFVATVDWPLHR